jgi:putative transposase
MKMEELFKSAKHNPPHLFRPDAIYMLTASTYPKDPIIRSDNRKIEWKEAFHKAAELYQWQVIAWVVLDNHYHAIAKSPADPFTLVEFVKSYHKFTSKIWNQSDRTLGRQVWHNYWDTCVRSEREYLARLKYVFWNPVKHGLVQEPDLYPYSNYADFVDTFSGVNADEVKDVPEV